VWRRKPLVKRWPGALVAAGAACMFSCALALLGFPAAQAASLAAHAPSKAAVPAALPAAGPAAVPAAPTGVTAAESFGDLTVGWKAVKGATGYAVLIRDITTKQKVFSKASWQQDPTSSTPLADINFNDFTAGHKYAFEVEATNKSGHSKPSAQATVTAVGIPFILYAVAGNRVAFFGWQDAAGATSYRVVQYDNCEFDYSAPVKVTAKQLTIRDSDGTKSTWVDVTGLTDGRCYDYIVEAYNSTNGDYPAVSTVDTFLEPMGTFAWKTATAGDRSAHLVWTSATGATEYQVYMANQTKHKNDYALVKTLRAVKGATQSLTVKGLVNGDTYSFYINAYDNYSGESATGVKSLTPRS
jgi:hypothetical protein